MSDQDEKPRLNLGYPLGQLARALAGVGGRAAARVKQWQQVLAGMSDGTLGVGSRTPVAGAPAWVTLEVVHGGFATGNFAAGGPLQAHEEAKLPSVPRAPGASFRAALNQYYASGAGQAELRAMLNDGRFRVHVPEEAALLVSSWLRARDEARAEHLLATVGGFFDRLRFYPVPHPRPLRSDASVHVATAGQVVKQLRDRRRQPSVEQMKEAIQIWAPLYDRTAALFVETIEAEQLGRRFAPDWEERARQLLDDYRQARTQHHLCGKPERPKQNFFRLREYLARCLKDRASLSAGDWAAIRHILADHAARHGAPGSARLRENRDRQARNAARPRHPDLARVLAARLDRHSADDGVPDLQQDLGALSADEAASIGAPAGWALPRPLVARARPCLAAPLEQLVAERLVPSSEAMARLLPHVTAGVRASAVADPELRRVYESVYTAFRQRRSLLLLDLESQAKLAELPWLQAIAPWTGGDDQSRRSARDTLVLVTRLALQTYPHTIVPNKLVKELRALAAAAGEDIPLVEELAADIFMGAFSDIFLRAAQAAARLLQGTLYERYYGLPYRRVLRFTTTSGVHGKATSPELAELCHELTGDDDGGKSPVARNGRIIEQCQLLTTHNLASLFIALDLGGQLHRHLPQMARGCFEWICARQQMRITDWKPQLQMMKNTAYAWRQMLFYLSLVEQTDVAAFVGWMNDHLAAQNQDFRARIAPAVRGLQAVAAGASFDADGRHAPSGGRRFLGWTLGPHWLLEPAPVSR